MVGLLAVGVAIFALRVKFRQDDRLTTEQFGADCMDCKQKVQRLTPYVW